MKFFTDAHISSEMVEMLRRLGHDVLTSDAVPPRTPDIDILQRAAEEARVVITADKDFGELVFVHGVLTPGVVLIRLELAHEADRVEYLEQVWPALMSRLPGHFLTVTVSGIRARPIP